MEPWIPVAGFLMGALAVTLLVRLLLDLEAEEAPGRTPAHGESREGRPGRARSTEEQLPRAA